MSSTLLNDDGSSNPSNNTHLNELVDKAQTRLAARRKFLGMGVGLATIPFFTGFAGCASEAASETLLGFEAVPISGADSVTVAKGYVTETMIPWGEAINSAGPAWKSDATNTAAEQEAQIGDNHDGMAFFGFNAAGTGFGDRSDEGLLVLNHEYINPEYFYAPGTDSADWLIPFTAEKARKAQAAHGVSVVHVKRKADGSWEHVKNSSFNRRIHGNTPITLQGVGAGDALVSTAADPTGTQALGTLNNCGNGRTPWGTYLTCEENFNGYFGWNGAHTASALENRYGISASGFGYRWHLVDPRFDVNATPNEPNRHGYVVEIDPFAPASTPNKRMALGRFKHENAELVIATNGKVVVYMGCDERNEYVYKFVSAGTFDRANPTSSANRKLLEQGTLYVAAFDNGAAALDGAGTGRWIALVHGQNGLTAANGFADQAHINIRTRQAADRVGATMMDRPEWVSANPNKAGEVFVTLTNNNRRGTTPASSINADGTSTAGSARPAVNDANPRSNNVWGHIVRWNEANADASALTFSWDIFLLAGQPSVTDARAPSGNIKAENLFNSPDGLAFDSAGRLWIQTDGSYANTGDFANMGNNQMLVADPVSKEVRRFLVGPDGCEITGITWTPDRTTMFINVQHPGEVGNHPRAPKNASGTVLTDNDIARTPTAFSQWPSAGSRPRSATVVVRHSTGVPVGSR